MVWSNTSGKLQFVLIHYAPLEQYGLHELGISKITW